MSPLPDVVNGNREPLYNIGVVSRMTGVSMATLRAWERRYDFPDSERTTGGHRLYSEKDLLRLRWVKERIDEGMQTSQAINALRHQETSGHLVESPASSQPSTQQPKEASTLLAMFQTRLFEALVRKDLSSAELLMGEAQASSSPEELIIDVIGPTMNKIGESWENGSVNIATEHFATNYLRQRLILWMMSGPPPRSLNPIVLACAPHEWHEGSLLMLAALLRRRRWPVAYLGQAVPLEELTGIVRELHPAMLILTAMTDIAVEELVDWPKYLPDVYHTGKPPFGYGGRIFVTQPEWRMRMPGTYLGDDYYQAIEQIERMI